ncbi:PleD family two-component system response regulator [Planktothrix sp. FACHB-1355]|uniref:PleD family two-component system response regulator n=1 Tax=Aerosakkonema funiforme FACHB-1375 TaxID=2949571 RepID=A0A926VKB0_9CYAN|nr:MULTISPECIES: PleD family two-component system response regulator [Oscillatoriales]MBD2185278.1 PleD family two-component system response regulator [Aerosakkonema funiforme FACHB-1375]MBD3559106.1 PleD family two-component system response regulator [Planktothrix sp. FACHB-1355]
MSTMNTGVCQPEPPSILIVDDEKMMRILLRRALEKEGYRVVEACDGQEAIEIYQRIKPDLVLLDAVMPIVDGFACCAKLQSLNEEDAKQTLLYGNPEGQQNSLWQMRSGRTPILIVTGLEDAASVDRAFEVGATDYVTKPIHWAVLRQRVRRLIEQAQLYKQLEAANQELQRIACLDGLTQVANRRGFDETLEREWRRMAREQGFLSLILCDVDFFKAFNDHFGHLAGDICLQQVAHAIREATKRPADLVARYGGEEFAVILPNSPDRGAIHVAQQIQANIAALKISHPQSGVSQYVTASLGLACIVPPPHSQPIMLIDAADKALYEAKASGRDRFILNSWES